MLNLEPARQLDFRVESDVLVVSAWEKKKKLRKKNPTCYGICWHQRTCLPAHGLVAGTGSHQAGTWGTAEDRAVLGPSPPGAPELIPSSPSSLFLVLYTLTHTCSSLTRLLFPIFTRCPVADSPEPRADVEAEKTTTRDTEPGLWLKQKNHSPQIHNRLVSQTQGFISSFVFFRSLPLLSLLLRCGSCFR